MGDFLIGIIIVIEWEHGRLDKLEHQQLHLKIVFNNIYLLLMNFVQ